MNDVVNNKKNETKYSYLSKNENGEVDFTLVEGHELFNVVKTQSSDRLKKIVSRINRFHQQEDGSTESMLLSVNSNLASLIDINPRDALEELLISQMLTTHDLFFKCSDRANIKNQYPERVDAYVKNLTSLSRLFLNQVKILNSYRNEGQQKVKVEHVHISDGGQAIFGEVNTRRGGQKKHEDK